MRVSRQEWAKRVERWQDSGLTAKEFAVELGVNPRTLVYWKWQLSRGNGSTASTSEAAKIETSRSTPLPLVDVTPLTHAATYELELSRGRRLTIPSTFDEAALRRLLAVLEGTT